MSVGAQQFTTAIVDVAHWEGASIHKLEAAKAAGLVAVIAKCTQGRDYVDPAYVGFRDECKRLGLLFGSFHFISDSSSGQQQADWYLQHADRDSLLAIDYEWMPKGQGHDAPLANAEAFVSRIHEMTGRWPLVYCARAYLTGERAPSASSVLGNCPLWVCYYVGAPPKLPVQPWRDWDLWQYTNGHANPTHWPTLTPELGAVDRSAFAGDEAALTAWWRSAGLPRGPQC